jgi:hypothetical protein
VTPEIDFAGPQLVVPRHRSRLPVEYKWIHQSMPGKLVEHRSPQQVPGRQKILNHGGLVAASFGWVWEFMGFNGITIGYAGSIVGYNGI